MTAVPYHHLVPLLLAFSSGCIFISDQEHQQRRGELIHDSGDDDTASPQSVDADGDGYTEDEDCDDQAPLVNPGANERCNGWDDDCDGMVDEDDAVNAATWYADQDGDGFGNPDDTRQACEQPSGWLDDDTDCDDGDGDVHPGAEETCDGVDEDCDGEIDEDSGDRSTWYADADGDGYGTPDHSVEACAQPSGYVADDTDCHDNDAGVYPGAEEICDDLDNDCDENVDNDAVDMSTWYIDNDGDGHGDAERSRESCGEPAGYVADDTDCDDRDAEVYPGAEETCDGVDQDCDGDVDEDATDAASWYADVDGDGYGDSRDSTSACDQPSGYVSDDTDCDDRAAAIHPDAEESCDEVDEDCDGVVDNDATDAASWYTDLDGDGYGDASLVTEACDQPSGYVSDDTDCDDGDVAVNPGATELCDDVDRDCDGTEAESGVVTHWDAHGTATDLGALFGAGSSGAATTVALADDGTIVLCDGTYFAQLEVTASDLAISSINGSASTVLDGAGDGTVITLSSSGSVTLTGLTVTNGDGGSGGGLYAADSALDLRVTSCSFEGNTADHGGGLYLADGTLTLSDTSFQDNEADEDGGGLYLSGTTASLTACTIDGNQASTYGGGLYADQSDLTLSATTVSSNDSAEGAGGLALQDTTAAIDGSTIQGNTASDWGGGVLVSASSLDLSSSLVIENEVTESSLYDVGGGVFVYDGSSLICTGSSKEDAGIYGNTAGDGGGVYLYDSSSSLESVECDWGSGSEDNEPDDVDLSYYGDSYDEYEDDESFSCTGGMSGSCR